MNERLLFVDDEASIRTGFERNLGFDFDLDTAASGAEALAMLADEEYAVVFTDMRMPGMSGIEFVKRAKDLNISTVFVMLTGNVDTETADAALQDAEVFRFLNKPCDGQELRNVIAEALAEYRSHVAA